MILEERGWIAVDPLGVRPAWLGRPGGGVALAVEAQLKHLAQRLHHQPFAARSNRCAQMEFARVFVSILNVCALCFVLIPLFQIY